MCIKYLSSACFDVDTDDDTLGLHIGSGAFVLLPYVFNNWLHHMAKVGREDFPRLIKDIERLIDTRVNPNFVGEALVSESKEEHSQPLNSVEGNINRTLDNCRAFSQRRKRDLSLDDCK